MRFHGIDCVGKIQIQRLTTSQRNNTTPLLGRLIYDTDENVLYVGNGTNWYQFFTSINDGSGSGLNADLIDGYEGNELKSNSLSVSNINKGIEVSHTDVAGNIIYDSVENLNADTVDGKHANDLDIQFVTINNPDGGLVVKLKDGFGNDTTGVLDTLNVGSIGGYEIGHEQGNIPISDGYLNNFLNAEYLNGQSSNYYELNYLTIENIDDYLVTSIYDKANRVIDATTGKINSDTVDGQHANDLKIESITLENPDDDLIVTLTDGFGNDTTSIVNDLNVNSVSGYEVGNSTNQIPISNGILNSSLNAEYLNNQSSDYYELDYVSINNADDYLTISATDRAGRTFSDNVLNVNSDTVDGYHKHQVVESNGLPFLDSTNYLLYNKLDDNLYFGFQTGWEQINRSKYATYNIDCPIDESGRDITLNLQIDKNRDFSDLIVDTTSNVDTTSWFIFDNTNWITINTISEDGDVPPEYQGNKIEFEFSSEEIVKNTIFYCRFRSSVDDGTTWSKWYGDTVRW